ncbi:MAG: transglycosylase SLT domain-containing protein, partial [Bacteroidetes bacterium]|nr:transglycosylase SLT domain-containing protein [Bacteroidota bacterium]
LQIINKLDTSGKFFIHIPQLYNEGWDSLPQAKFWRTLIRLNPDSGIVNVASSRKILEIVNSKEWDKRPDASKEAYRDSIRKTYNLAADEKIFFTKGKADFYDFEGAMETIDQGVAIFEKEKTDPFYAQTILLIESPGQCAKSPVGACGSFQLMKGVAIQMGLKVNNSIDERKDFDRSAQGAARLIRTVCIPQAKEMCAKYGLKYSENDLWFRLLVLHNYHAGAGNVGRALSLIQPTSGNMDLITTLWQTKAGAFGNASQNYSQVAIAALLELDDIIFNKYDNVLFHPLAFKD